MERFDRDWVSAQVEETVHCWQSCRTNSIPVARCYSVAEQEAHEHAYCAALQLLRDRLTESCVPNLAERIIEAFSGFSIQALGLESESIKIMTDEFLPIGVELARFARMFHPDLGMSEIIQAARNAWTACGLQPLLGMPVKLTPAILGYSLLYPYSDNYLDNEELSTDAKLLFSARFRSCLAGDCLRPKSKLECSVWNLIELIESQFPRAAFEAVYQSLLAIHQAQEDSVRQLHGTIDSESLRLSCAKGGASVLADAYLVRGSLSSEEQHFAFQWGVLLQLGDDLQDLNDDLQRGSNTVFSGPAREGRNLDETASQLLNFGEYVGGCMALLPNGSESLRHLLRTAWQSLIIRAIAQSHEFFSSEFLIQTEKLSPFRFAFLRQHHEGFTASQGLHAKLFQALTGYSGCCEPPGFSSILQPGGPRLRQLGVEA